MTDFPSQDVIYIVERTDDEGVLRFAGAFTSMEQAQAQFTDDPEMAWAGDDEVMALFPIDDSGEPILNSDEPPAVTITKQPVNEIVG